MRIQLFGRRLTILYTRRSLIGLYLYRAARMSPRERVMVFGFDVFRTPYYGAHVGFPDRDYRRYFGLFPPRTWRPR